MSISFKGNVTDNIDLTISKAKNNYYPLVKNSLIEYKYNKKKATCKKCKSSHYEINMEQYNGYHYCKECLRITIALRKEFIERHRVTPEKYAQEMQLFHRIINTNISCICAVCGDISFFFEKHHILGRKSDKFTVSLCSDCHDITYHSGFKEEQTDRHCKKIGGKIEFGALCYPTID